MNHAPDLLVSADDGIQLSLPRGVGKVARVLLQRLILVFRILIRYAVRAAHGFQCLEQIIAGDADGIEQGLRLRAFDIGECEKEMLGGDVLVAQLLGLVLGAIEDLIELAREIGLRAALLRVPRDFPLHAFAKRGDAGAKLLENRDNDALLLVEQRGEKMDVVDCRITVSPRERHRLVQCFAGLHGEAFGIDHVAA